MNTARSRGGRPPQLTADHIITAAIALLNQEGLDALSMRKLGNHLGVAAMSLYRHIPDRNALLAAVVNRLFATALSAVTPQKTWTETLQHFATHYRHVLLHHPHAVPLLATHPVDLDTALPLITAIVDQFTQAGINHDDALIALQSVGVYVLGHALAQTGTPPGNNAPQTPMRKEELHYYEHWFNTGLTAMISGFAQRHQKT